MTGGSPSRGASSGTAVLSSGSSASAPIPGTPTVGCSGASAADG